MRGTDRRATRLAASACKIVDCRKSRSPDCCDKDFCSCYCRKIEVRWPSGQKQEFQNIPADALYEIDEERGLHKLMPLPALSK